MSRRVGSGMAEQEPVELAHWRVDPDGRDAQNFGGHLRNRAWDAVRKGGQVMRDRADLTPSLQARIRFQTQHMCLDRGAGLAIGHVIGLVAGQIDRPEGEAVDLH